MINNTFKPAIAKVGGPWDGANPKTWPGVGGTPGTTNYYDYNTGPSLPDPESTPLTHYNSETPKTGMSGGRKRKGKTTKRKSKTTKRKSKTTKRGGGSHGNTIVPQPVVNLGRTVTYQGKNLWNSFVGNSPAINPDPLVQPIVK